jgi:hypothetical protein
VDLSRGPKSRTAAILTLEDRIVIAWSDGTFRPKDYASVIPRSQITSVVEDVVPAKTMVVARPVLRVRASEEWTLTHHNLYEGGPNIPAMLALSFDGGVTFDYDVSGV